MIFCKKQPGMPSGNESVSAVMAEMVRLFGTKDEDGLHAAREVATGVRAFLADRDVAAAGPSHVRALVSRALISTGRKDMASRLLLVGGGLVKQSRSALIEHGAVLILDLRQLVRTGDECLDLTFRRCLLLLVDSMAHMWDESGGRGMLGLRNVRPAARIVLGRGVGPGEVNLLVRETRALCASKLDVLRRRRNWEERPLVFVLDWAAAGGRRLRRKTS